MLQFCGRHEEAVDETAGAIAANPDSTRAHLVLGLAREQQGRMAEAVTSFERAVAVSRGRSPGVLGGLGHACARNGRRDGVDRAFAALSQLHPDVTNLAKALIRVGMEDCDEALRLLRCACDAREFGLATLAVDARFDRLRGAPEFRHILGRIGLNVGTA